jgi:adenosine deaminase/aminodeoxyfutalosine deaminase
MDDIQAFIRRLPKAELHLHLEGTISPATLVELSQRHDVTPITLPEAEALYRFANFTEFINAFRAVTRQLAHADDYELAAWRMMQHLAEQGVVHAEVFISVGVIYMWRNHDPACFEPIFAGLERARIRAERELGLSVYWIFDAVRHFSIPEAERVFAKAAEMRAEFPSIIGIGLGGDERQCGSEPFRDMYAHAREAGLRLTNHAGETTGPEAIWEALNIGSERLGHVLSAVEDQNLLQELKTRSVALELNPTSNVRTGVCPSFAGRGTPIAPMKAAGATAASMRDFSSPSTPTTRLFSAPMSPTNTCSLTPNRDFRGMNCEILQRIPSAPAFFRRQLKIHG